MSESEWFEFSCYVKAAPHTLPTIDEVVTSLSRLGFELVDGVAIKKVNVR